MISKIFQKRFLGVHRGMYVFPTKRHIVIIVLAITALIVCLQGALGISTLLNYVQTHIAATHQAGAVALLSMGLWFARELKRIPK